MRCGGRPVRGLLSAKIYSVAAKREVAQAPRDMCLGKSRNFTASFEVKF